MRRRVFDEPAQGDLLAPFYSFRNGMGSRECALEEYRERVFLERLDRAVSAVDPRRRPDVRSVRRWPAGPNLSGSVGLCAAL